MASHLVIILAVVGLAQCKLLELSCSQIRTFVDGHNSRRIRVAKGEVDGQPAAGKMNSMVWDDELAKKAAYWASQNPHNHNPDKTVASGKYRTGENIYWYQTEDSSYKLDPDSALQAWFDEHKDYTFRPIKKSDFFQKSKDIGHYTQMVWSNTTHVGCGISQNDNGKEIKFFVVCNYGPAGNMLGEEPYRTDKRGSGKLVCGADDCSRPYGDQCSQNA